jgi:hypothetical protein
VLLSGLGFAVGVKKEWIGGGVKTGFDFFTLEKYASSSCLKGIAESGNHWVGMDTTRERSGGRGRDRATDRL